MHNKLLLCISDNAYVSTLTSSCLPLAKFIKVAGVTSCLMFRGEDSSDFNIDTAHVQTKAYTRTFYIYIYIYISESR